MIDEVKGLRDRAERLAAHTPLEAQVYATLYLAEQYAEATEFAQQQLLEMRAVQEKFIADLKKELEDER